MTVDSRDLSGKLIPAFTDTADHRVEVVLLG
jgi:hypothetical protein